MPGEVLHDAWFVERLDAQAKMVDVACFCLGSFSADPPEFPVNGDEVDHGAARPDMDQSKISSATLDFATEDQFVEGYADVQITNAKYKMVNSLD